MIYLIYYKIQQKQIYKMIQKQQIKTRISQKTQDIARILDQNKKVKSEKVNPQQITNYSAFFADHKMEDIFKKSQMFMKLAENKIFWQQFKPFDTINKIMIKSISPLMGYQIVKMKITLNAFQTEILILNMQEESKNHTRNELGKGAVGTVYQSNICNHSIACKCFPIKKQQNLQTQFLSIIKEYFLAKIMSALQIGPKIYSDQTFDIVKYSDCFQFKMEKCQEVSSNKKIQEDLKKSLMVLHKLKIVHRDIKPANILYSNYYGKFVLCDFGLMQFVDGNVGQKIATVPVGTYSYLPQQVRIVFYLARTKQQNIYTDLYYNDYWALKLSLLQILSKPKIEQKQDLQLFMQQQYTQDPIIQILFNLYHNKFQQIVPLRRYFGQYKNLIAFFLSNMQPNEKVRYFYIDIFRKICCSYLFDQYYLDNIYTVNCIKTVQLPKDNIQKKKQFWYLYDSLQKIEQCLQTPLYSNTEELQAFIQQQIKLQSPVKNVIVSFIMYVYNSIPTKYQDEKFFKICNEFSLAYLNLDLQKQLQAISIHKQNKFEYTFKISSFKRILINDTLLQETIIYFLNNVYSEISWNINLQKNIMRILFDVAIETSHPLSRQILSEICKLPFDKYEQIDYALTMRTEHISSQELQKLTEELISSCNNQKIKQLLSFICTKLILNKYSNGKSCQIDRILEKFQQFPFLIENMVQTYTKILEYIIMERSQINQLMQLLIKYESIVQKYKKVRAMNIMPQVIIAKQYLYLGDYHKANFYIQKVQKVLGEEITENIGWFHISKGTLAYNRKQYKKAQYYFDKDLKLMFKSKKVYLTILLQINNIIHRQNNYNGKYMNILEKEAQQIERQCRQDQPVYQQILFQMLKFQLDCKDLSRHIEKTLELFQKYQKVAGKNELYISLLLDFYMQLQQREKAKQIVMDGVSLNSRTGKKNMCTAAYLFYSSSNPEEKKRGEDILLRYHEQIPYDQITNQFLEPFVAILLIKIYIKRNDAKNLYKYLKKHCSVINSLNSIDRIQSLISIVSSYEKTSTREFDAKMLQVLQQFNWFAMGYKYKPFTYFILRLIFKNKQSVSKIKPFQILFQIASILPNIQKSLLDKMRYDYYKLYSYFLKHSKNYNSDQTRSKINQLSQQAFKYWKDKMIVPKIYSQPKIKTSSKDIRNRIIQKCNKFVSNLQQQKKQQNEQASSTLRRS